MTFNIIFYAIWCCYNLLWASTLWISSDFEYWAYPSSKKIRYLEYYQRLLVPKHRNKASVIKHGWPLLERYISTIALKLISNFQKKVLVHASSGASLSEWFTDQCLWHYLQHLSSRFLLWEIDETCEKKGSVNKTNPHWCRFPSNF